MKVISVKFKENGRSDYFDPCDFEIKEGDYVIVTTARGTECGEVVRASHEVPGFSREVKPVIRVADAVDIRRMRQNRADVQQAYTICEQRIAAHGLKMKLVDAEYTLDRSKLVFYFTADNRVDFRELVKDLAAQFHTRIELRKIDNDWKRVERQRTVIQAVLDQVKNASVVELDSLLNTVLPLIQTNFTKSEIAALLVQLPGFLGCDVQQMSMPLQGTYGIRTGMDNRLMYDPDWVVNIKALQDFLYNDKTAEEVAAATPETAAAEAAGELVIATRESADVTDPVEEYNSKYLHRIDMTYALDASDFGSDEYRVFVADTDNLRGNELRGALIDKLYSASVRVVAVPDGAAAGVLLDNYLQTGNTGSLDSYLSVLPADRRDSARTLWEHVRTRYPGVFHAAGLGADARSATVGKALTVLANASHNTPETEIAEAVQVMRSGTTSNAVYWFKTAMAKYPRQMERFFGSSYAAVSRLYYAMQGTLNVADDSELPTYDAKQLLKTYKKDGILIFTDEASALMTEGSMASELQAQLDKQKYGEDEDPQRVCAIGAVYGTWSNAGSFTPDDTETAWDADSLTEYLGGDALRGKDMLLALDGEDSPYLTENCLLKDTDTPVAEQLQKLFVLDKNNMASPESAESE